MTGHCHHRRFGNLKLNLSATATPFDLGWCCGDDFLARAYAGLFRGPLVLEIVDKQAQRVGVSRCIVTRNLIFYTHVDRECGGSVADDFTF